MSNKWKKKSLEGCLVRQKNSLSHYSSSSHMVKRLFYRTHRRHILTTTHQASPFTYFTAGFFEFRKASASLEAFATKATCLGSLRLPMRVVEGSGVAMPSNCGFNTIPVDVNGLIPRLNPSSSLMTAIKRN